VVVTCGIAINIQINQVRFLSVVVVVVVVVVSSELNKQSVVTELALM
jgi:hypothetical protein